MKIQINFFTANHLKTDDQIEHVNIIMKYYFWIFINYFQNNWIQWFFNAEFAINNTNFFNIFVSFFLANYNQHFHVRFESEKSLFQNFTTQNHVNLIVVNKFIKCMKNLNKHFQKQMLVAQIIYKFAVNVYHHFCSWYIVENQIWLNTCNFNTAQFSVKLDNYNVKSFFVIKVYEFNLFIMKLDFSEIIQIYFIFHVNLL